MAVSGAQQRRQSAHIARRCMGSARPTTRTSPPLRSAAGRRESHRKRLRKQHMVVAQAEERRSPKPLMGVRVLPTMRHFPARSSADRAPGCGPGGRRFDPSRAGMRHASQHHRGVAQLGSAPALGAGGRGFKSLHPDTIRSPSPVRLTARTPAFQAGNSGSDSPTGRHHTAWREAGRQQGGVAEPGLSRRP